MVAMKRILMPGDRVEVFDNTLFCDDISTPLSVTMKPATIVCRYGRKSQFGIYPDLVDVVFDHRPERVSKAHFTNFVVLSGV